MKIYIGSDHAGFELKGMISRFLMNLGHEVVDKGAYQFLPDDDYPDFIIPVAQAISNDGGDPERSRGIIFGGSGQGEAIVANRFPHVRAVVFNGQYAPKDGREIPNEIKISREHNDSNILSLGARFLNEAEAQAAVKLWLETAFSNDGRHIRRLQKVDLISKA
ncbi:MAG: RpiB/LacA/LacB family sugar-phosphate isomerase [Patescibacteria group bacterium]